MLNILPITTVVLGLVCITLAVLYILAWRDARKWHAGYDDLMRENKQLEREREDARSQRDRLNTRCAIMQGELDRTTADNERYVDAIEELRLEVVRLQKSADRATIPMKEVNPAPKRPVRAKKAGQA